MRISKISLHEISLTKNYKALPSVKAFKNVSERAFKKSKYFEIVSTTYDSHSTRNLCCIWSLNVVCVQATCALIHDCDLNNNCQVSRTSFSFGDNGEVAKTRFRKGVNVTRDIKARTAFDGYKPFKFI